MNGNNDVRSFPRYSCESKKMALKFQQGLTADVINLSIGGICLESPKRLQNMQQVQQKAVMIVAKQQFNLNMQCIWELEVVKPIVGRIYRSGWSLYFDRMEDFHPWMIFMQALEKLEAKQIGRQP